MHKRKQISSKKAWTRLGRDVARRDPSAWGRTFRTAIDDTTRQWSESAAEPRCPIPESDVRRHGWRRTWGRRKCTAVHAATFQRVQHGAASRLHADGGDPRIPARTGAIRTQSDEPTIPELGLRDAHSQQQYWTPQGPLQQMAQDNMTKQMLLDQCVKMGISFSTCTLGSIIRTSSKVSSRTSISSTTQQTRGRSRAATTQGRSLNGGRKMRRKRGTIAKLMYLRVIRLLTSRRATAFSRRFQLGSLRDLDTSLQCGCRFHQDPKRACTGCAVASGISFACPEPSALRPPWPSCRSFFQSGGRFSVRRSLHIVY
jgi:hypothetical protein